MPEKAPTKTEILGVVQAQSDSLQGLSERVVKIEKISEKFESLEDLTSKQDVRNQNILYAVLFALVLIIVSVGTEVILSNKQDNSISSRIIDIQDNNAGRISDLELKNADLEKEIEILKIKNPYLK